MEPPEVRRMKSDRAVVGCILVVMAGLTGALLFSGTSSDRRLLDLRMGPNTPATPATLATSGDTSRTTSNRADNFVPESTAGDDLWTHADGPVAAEPTISPVISLLSSRLSGSGLILAEPSGDDVALSRFDNHINVSFTGKEGFVTLSMPTQFTADTDGDGNLTAADLDAFTAKWEAMGMDADFNGDGVVDTFDLAAFIESFEAGESRPMPGTRVLSRITLQLSNDAAAQQFETAILTTTVQFSDETK